MEKSALFESVVALGKDEPKNASNWILGDVSRVMNETGKPLSELNISAEHLSALIELVEKNTISNSAGKTVFEEMLKTATHPRKSWMQRAWARFPTKVPSKPLWTKS